MILANAEPWAAVFGNIILFCLAVGTPILTVLAVWAAARLAKRLGLDNTTKIEALVGNAAKIGIAKAEKWAKRQTQKPRGESKLEIAIQTATRVLNSEHIRNIAREKLEDIIEAKLGSLVIAKELRLES